MKHRFEDKLAISGTRIRESDGVLLCDAKVARTGIQLYSGNEVGRPEMKVVRVYRSPMEVFSDKAMASFAHKHVTNDHPTGGVSAENWKKTAVGNTADEVEEKGRFLRVPLMVSDASAIADIENGKRELSAGYACDLDWTGGITPDGEPFDAAQTNIRANHIAIVQQGRAGKECRIGDGAMKWGATPLTSADVKGNNMELQTIMVDGLSVKTTETGAQTIQKLLADKKDNQSKIDKLKADIAAKKGELDALNSAMEKEKDNKPTDAEIDKRADERGKLKADAKTVLGDSFDGAGQSTAAIKTAILAKTMGDSLAPALAGLSDDNSRTIYVDAAYAADLAHRASIKAQQPDAFRASFVDGIRPTTDANAWDFLTPEQGA